MTQRKRHRDYCARMRFDHVTATDDVTDDFETEIVYDNVSTVK